MFFYNFIDVRSDCGGLAPHNLKKFGQKGGLFVMSLDNDIRIIWGNSFPSCSLWLLL